MTTATRSAIEPPPIPTRDRVTCETCGKRIHRHSTIIQRTETGWLCYECKPATTSQPRRRIATYHDRPWDMLTPTQRRLERLYADEYRDWLDERDTGVIAE